MYYIASPFTSTDIARELNRYEIALRTTWNFMNNKINCFSPIIYGFGFYRAGLTKGDYITWLNTNRMWMFKSDGLIVLQLAGWQQSKGVLNEIDYFLKRNKPVLYLDLEQIDRINRGDRFQILLTDKINIIFEVQ